MEIVAAAECIFRVTELINRDLCRSIIENYEQDLRKHPGYTVGSRGETKANDPVKVSTDLPITNEGAWRAVQEELHRRRCRAVSNVLDPHALWRDSQV